MQGKKHSKSKSWRKDAPGVVRARFWLNGVRSRRSGVVAAKCQYRYPVVAFELETGQMKRFCSMNAAGLFCVENGLSLSVPAARVAVYMVCSGRRKSAFGFVWCLDLQALYDDHNGKLTRLAKWERGLKGLDDLKRKYAMLTKHPVIGFEIDGGRIVRFPSGNAAAAFCVAEGLSTSLSSSAGMISMAVRGIRRSACGYEWGHDWTAVEEHVVRRQPVIARLVRSNKEQLYLSEGDAARDMVRLGFAKTIRTARVAICHACAGGRLTLYGRTWRIAPLKLPASRTPDDAGETEETGVVIRSDEECRWATEC